MAPSLFSPGPRLDSGPAPYAISEYEALDRSPHEASERTRQLLDEWYGGLPSAAVSQIRERFTAKRDIVHRRALLELYLDALFRAMGFDVDLDIGRDDNGQRRPDILLGSAGDAFYVEATALVGADIGDPVIGQRLDEIHDAVNAVNAPAFMVDLRVTRNGSGTPSRRKITADVQSFLDGLDPDHELALVKAGGETSARTITVGGWELSLIADPLEPEHRDYPHHRVLATRDYGADTLDDITPLRHKLRRKATHYGELGKPYVVAILCAGTFVEDHDINAALMGPNEYRCDPQSRAARPVRQRNGVWMGHHGPINRRLSAVLTLNSLSATAICAVQPTLWLNPWATHPLTDLGPWRRIEFHPTGAHDEHPATATVADVLGLPDRWPFEVAAIS